MLRTFARAVTLVALLGAGVLVWRAPDARALEELRGEKEAIKACDKRLCAILTQKSPKGEDLKCALTKTWARSKIKEAENSKLTWGYGDARCTVDINIERLAVVQAMTGERDKFWVQPHTANCIVESDGKMRSRRRWRRKSSSRTAGSTRSGSISRASKVRPLSRPRSIRQPNSPTASACSTGAW